MSKPIVSEFDKIWVGSTKAVICKILKNDLSVVEVVYLDHKNKAINEDVCWNGNSWEFVISTPCGGYADNNPRLASYVSSLRKT